MQQRNQTEEAGQSQWWQGARYGYTIQLSLSELSNAQRCSQHAHMRVLYLPGTDP